MVKENNFVLEFRKSFGSNQNNLDGNAGYSRKKNSAIVVTQKWAYQLVSQNTTKTKNAFLFTLGHEITHKSDSRIVSPILHLPHFSLYSWIREIHADFGAAKKFGGKYDRDALLCSIDYKTEHNGNGIDNPIHPSWTTRKQYVAHYNFNDELLNKIARDLKLNPTSMLMKIRLNFILKTYKQVVLNQEPYEKREFNK